MKKKTTAKAKKIKKKKTAASKKKMSSKGYEFGTFKELGVAELGVHALNKTS